MDESKFIFHYNYFVQDRGFTEEQTKTAIMKVGDLTSSDYDELFNKLINNIVRIELTLSDEADGDLFLSENEPPNPDGVYVIVPFQKSFGGQSFDGLGFMTSGESIQAIKLFILHGVLPSLVSNWLYDKFKKCKSTKITINRKEIIVEEGEITRIIEETISISTDKNKQ